MNEDRAESIGLALVLAAAILWGLLGVFTAGLLDLGVGAVEIAFWRALFGGSAFLAHALAARRLVRLPWRNGLATVAFAAVGVSLFYVALIRAIDLGGISLAFVLLYTAPAWVTLLAGPVLGERPGRRQWLLVGGSVVGVALVSSARGEGVTASAAAIGWGLAAGLGYASYYLLGKRLLVRQAPVQLYGLALPLGAAGIAPFVTWGAKPPLAWALLAGAAIVSTYLAYLLYGLGLRRATASRAVLVATVEPLVAGALAWALYGERLGAWGLAGAALVLGCAAASGIRPRGPRRTPLAGSDLS
ncbi:MAG: DMT family transporter [Trueperaceae bacterium]|nr:DMT family transporter [Trueperaceae bacterium]